MTTPNEPTPLTAAPVDLHSTTDAMVWTKEFSRLFPDHRPDDGTMLGWFANAIETGRSAGLAATPPAEADLRAALTADLFRSAHSATVTRMLDHSISPGQHWPIFAQEVIAALASQPAERGTE